MFVSGRGGPAQGSGDVPVCLCGRSHALATGICCLGCSGRRTMEFRSWSSGHGVPVAAAAVRCGRWRFEYEASVSHRPHAAARCTRSSAARLRADDDVRSQRAAAGVNPVDVRLQSVRGGGAVVCTKAVRPLARGAVTCGNRWCVAMPDGHRPLWRGRGGWALRSSRGRYTDKGSRAWHR